MTELNLFHFTDNCVTYHIRQAFQNFILYGVTGIFCIPYNFLFFLQPIGLCLAINSMMPKKFPLFLDSCVSRCPLCEIFGVAVKRSTSATVLMYVRFYSTFCWYAVFMASSMEEFSIFPYVCTVAS